MHRLLIGLLLSVVLIGPSAGAQVLITEFLFSAVADRGCEYVELFNAGADSVPLRSAKIIDASGRVQAGLPAAAGIRPGGFLLVAANKLVYEQFPWLRDSGNVIIVGRAGLGLNVDADHLVLRDRRGVTLDSVAYRDDWHRPDLPSERGMSLERISIQSPSNDRRNWSSSVARAGGTPGAANSVSLRGAAPQHATMQIDPRVVSPDADGRDDFVRILYRLPLTSSWIMVTLHDTEGRLLRRIANNELTGSEGEIIFDGCDDARQPLNPGIYVVRIEAYDGESHATIGVQEGLIVARRGD